MIAAALAPFDRSGRRDVDALPPARPTREEFQNPNVVKAVVGQDGFALYFSRAPCPSTGRPTGAHAARPGARVQAHRALRVPPRRRFCASPRCRRRALEETETARAAARARARHPHQGRRNRARLDWRRHRRRRRARARAARGVTVRLPCRDPCRRSCPALAPLVKSRQVHLRHRRRRLVARQGPRRRLHRLPARGPRLQGHAAEVRPLHQRRSGDDEPVPARRGLRHRRRRRGRPRPRPLRALHQHGDQPQPQLDRPARSSCRSSSASGAATTSAPRCR